MTSVLLASFLALVPQDAERIQKLIATLGDASKEERDKAVKELASIGRPALDALRKATSSSDNEVKALAAQAIEKIEWGGVDKLKAYAKENLDEGANVEMSKLKAFGRWFPESRLYEVAGGAPAPGGAAAMMGMQSPKSLFVVRKYESGFHRLMVKGIYCGASIRALIAKEKIVLANEESALDFALAFVELYAAGVSQNPTAMMLSGGISRLEKVDGGWSLESASFGANVVFKTDAEGKLLDVSQSSNPLNAWGLQTGDRRSDEEKRLELEKLKLEVELLKKQLEKK
jgi:hypothetical protein